MNKELSIIIVAYKNREVLIECINSIYKFNDIGDRLEIIVVDNSPTNEYIYDFLIENYKNVITIKNDNKGFGQGNNVGVRNSKGKYILFLNPDTILVEPIFQYSIDKFILDKNLALFGVRLLDSDLKKNESFFFKYNFGLFHSIMLKVFIKLDIFISSKMFIAGADMFVRRDIFIKAGMFDENIFMYGEETDIINRICNLKKEYKIKYFKDKQIIHLEGKSSDINIVALDTRMKSTVYLGKKYKFNYIKKIKAELRYNKIKYLIYNLIKSNKAEEIEKRLLVYKKYL